MTASFVRRVVILLSAIALLGAVTSVAEGRARHLHDPCANRLCTEYKPGTPSCMRFHHGSRGLVAEQRRVRCYVARAARHFRIDLSRALYVSHRESKWHSVPRPANPYGYKGPFQMSRTLFLHTPYGRKLGDRRESPKWAALVFALLEKLGQGCNWNPPRYCA